MSDAPVLRIVRGDATAEEVAALVAVVAGLAAGAPAPPPRGATGWRDRSRLVREPLRPGPGAWSASALPR